jgi:hypothetical protein
MPVKIQRGRDRCADPTRRRELLSGCKVYPDKRSTHTLDLVEGLNTSIIFHCSRQFERCEFIRRPHPEGSSFKMQVITRSAVGYSQRPIPPPAVIW